MWHFCFTKWHWKSYFASNSVLLCQNHSTNTPQQFSFALSESFHQYSTTILFCSVRIIPPILHNNSLLLFQNHSTNTPQQFCFALSESFHQYSTTILFCSVRIIPPMLHNNSVLLRQNHSTNAPQQFYATRNGCLKEKQAKLETAMLFWKLGSTE